MSLTILFFSLFGAVTLGVFFYFLRKTILENSSQKWETELALLKQQLDFLNGGVKDFSTQISDKLQANLKMVFDTNIENRKILEESNNSVGQRLDNAARVVGEVQNRLGKVEEATKQVYEVGKDISRLQEILRAPKLRGILGELFLGDLLTQVLPKDRFTLQYAFRNGEKVDAVIKAAHGLICVDSKFPLENFVKMLDAGRDANEDSRKALRKIFLQDVKKHIDRIHQKYILPDEGTLEFALMYIPAENVYYETIIKNDELEKDILSYAQEKKVFPVSPNSFFAYLQTISIGLKGLQLEDGVKHIMAGLSGLKKELGRFEEDFRKLGGHIHNAQSIYDQSDKRLQKFTDKMENLTDAVDPNALPLESPVRLIGGESLGGSV